MRVLLTGGAGFIGSHIADALLTMPEVQLVRVFDNLATGNKENIVHLMEHPKFEFVEGDIRNFDQVVEAMKGGVTHVCHQAALGSVPRSIKDPITTHAVNATGTLHVLEAAKSGGVKRVVYAASSSTYGDSTNMPKVEHIIGRPLSPYAVTKYENELYAHIYGSTYQLPCIGLRYFNVFGPRQMPGGPYAAVIPLFVTAVLQGIPPTINGDGTYSRDFTYVDNAVQANIKALTTTNQKALNQVYNIAFGERTSLNTLFDILREIANSYIEPNYGPIRAGDIPHSHANIEKARELLGYAPAFSVRDGLKETYSWYVSKR